VLAELPAWYHYAGMALVFGGIALTLRRSSLAAPASKA
jgi:drug/metabolite transporter (DMT)-like permease